MAKTPSSTPANQELESAINKVLEEEQAAKQALEAAKDQAQALLNEAQARAQHIQHRTDERIRNMHNRCDTAISTQRNQLQREQTQANARDIPESDTDDLLSQAVAEIARRLTTNNKG